MNHQVYVAVSGYHPVIHVGIQPSDGIHIRCVNPERERCPQVVIQRWLTCFLLPRTCQVRIEYLDWQRITVRKVFDHWIVPEFIRGLKDRGRSGVGDSQNRKEDKNEYQPALFSQ